MLLVQQVPVSQELLRLRAHWALPLQALLPSCVERACASVLPALWQALLQLRA